MGVKETLKKIPGLKQLGRFVKYALPESRAAADLIRERRIPRQGKIKVGFLCQYMPAWDKMEPVYRRMLADDRFEPVLLCVPSGIENHRLTDPDSLENDTYRQLISLGYPEARNTLIGKEQWLDLKAMDLSYIFTVRPYDSFMPLPYTSRALSRHSRICLLLYGMTFAREDSEICMNRRFMSRVCLHFAETDYVCKFRLAQHGLKHRLGLQKTVRVGLPAAQSILASREKRSSSWDFSKNNFRVMWTPRWTTDPKVGGTNFLTYAEALVDYAASHPDTDFLFRPHPLMFDNFVKTGVMTPEDVADYKARCEKLPNLAFDPESRYDATFWGSDVLVSDISGMIPEYLFTGKPLIFCHTNMALSLLPPMRTLLDSCYWVGNARELFDCLQQLQAGNDPLAQARRDAVRAVFGDNDDPAAQIIEQIALDAKR